MYARNLLRRIVIRAYCLWWWAPQPTFAYRSHDNGDDDQYGTGHYDADSHAV
jgi:hypothetical protein